MPSTRASLIRSGHPGAWRPFRALLLALVLSSLVPGWASAQAEPPPDEAPPSSPLEILLERRDSLGLSPDQLTRLDRIRERLATANEPLIARMMTLRSQWQQQRRVAARNRGELNEQRTERIRIQAARVRTRIQANNRAAMQSVNQLLTAGQRKQLRSFVQERREQKPGERTGRGSNADDQR